MDKIHQTINMNIRLFHFLKFQVVFY